MAEEKKTAMISSTSVDLPEHRKEAIDACLRQGFFPIAMEHLPARDADAIRVSLEMVDKADVYIGIYAWRYGHVPEGHDISITEMEFNRAVERGIPILVFLIHKDHPLTIEMVETDKVAQENLKQLKERASRGRGRLQFKSAVDLRSHIIQSLGALLKEQEAASEEKRVPSLHPPNIIPEAPKPYIAHPYSLLQTKEVVGRREELNRLTDWVTTNRQVPRDVRLFNVVAIGGMGKSALTWKWFNDIAPNELPHLAGRMWWSFYESDAYFENFVIRALAYAGAMPEEEVRKLPSQEVEDQLFKLLDEKPFLLVLDGLERILLAYARMDAAHLADDDLDEQTANVLARVHGLPDDVKETYLEKHRLRLCADPRAGRFLRRLTRVRESRVLISTRLYPAELQTNTAQPWPGCYAYFIRGLTDDDALALWREFIGGERSGTSEQLLPLFNAFENYPLLVRALAGEVAEYKPAPGDFDRWHKDHPDFNPAALPLQNARTHVLEFALRGLNEIHRGVLHTIAAFRMPATWDTLRAVLVGEGKPCGDDRALDETLTELEDRGLIGWDKRSNRYDMHPIVRGVVWGGLGDDARRGVYTNLHTHFDAMPKIDDWKKVSRLEDLTPAIELYNTLIGLRRHDDAYDVFYHRLSDATLYRLSASRQMIDLLEMLFPGGLDQLPPLRDPLCQADILNTLAAAYHFNGLPGQAAPLFYRANAVVSNLERDIDVSIVLDNLSGTLRVSGALFKAESAARRALVITCALKNRSQEAISLYWLALELAARGAADESAAALQRALRIFVADSSNTREGVVNAYLGQRALWFGAFAEARARADRAWNLAHVRNLEGDFIRAARVQGVATLGLGDFAVADERLHHALLRARQVNNAEEELPALIALAELRRQQEKPDEAREYLDEVWSAAERGPYPLFHADAFNVLAQIERDAGNTTLAIEAATQAYRLAWCDGPPFAYHWGLVAAQKHLQDLGAPEPEMPPFDESKFEPMPEVEIDPDDEFHSRPVPVDQ
jgi:tetratricopeptide (TPR) repeat protein